MEHKDIAIVGMSCFLPGADDINAFWNNLINKVSSITEIPENRIDPVYFKEGFNGKKHFYSKYGGFLNDIIFNPLELGISTTEVEEMTPTQVLTLHLVYQALKDAAIFDKDISLHKASVIIGRENYSTAQNAENISKDSEQLVSIIQSILPHLSSEDVQKIKTVYQNESLPDNIITISRTTPNLLASMVASKLNMYGSAFTVDASDLSSVVALDQGIQELLSGRSDIAVAGGVFLEQDFQTWDILTQLGVLSHKNKIYPFSEDADGFVIGEGAAFVVLKTLDRAIADKDRVYAVIKGIGITNDSLTDELKLTSFFEQENAIKKAWQNSMLDPQQLSYLEINGIAIPESDKAEISALINIFGLKSSSKEILIGSQKPNIGHAMSAAGIIGLIKASLSLYNRIIPPTLNIHNLCKEFNESPFRFISDSIEWDDNRPLIAGVNSFGIGGTNAHIVLEGKDQNQAISDEPLKFNFEEEVIVLSAPTKEGLMNKLANGLISDYKFRDQYRLVLFNPTEERKEKAKRFIEKDKPWKGKMDIWFSNEPLLLNPNNKIAFLFPGYDPTSGSETDSLAKLLNYTMSQEYYMDDNIDPNSLLSNTLKLYRNGNVIDYALKKLGVSPDLNAGHSLGEWFATKAGGLMSDKSVRQMILSINPEQFEIEGIYFIAVGCGIEKITHYFDEIPNLYLSNDNCPTQVILCGTEEATESATEKLKSAGIFHQILPFKSGFHTPFVADKLEMFEEMGQYLDIRKSKIPIWSATTLDVYPDNNQDFIDLLMKHLTRPVQFRELIDILYKEQNVRVFVQIGAGGLVGFVDDTLRGRDYSAISTSVNLKSVIEQLRRVIALLFIEGERVNTDFLHGSDKMHKVENNQLRIQPIITPKVRDFSQLRNLLTRYRVSTSVNTLNSKSESIQKTEDPILNAWNKNINEMFSLQEKIVKASQASNIKSHSGIKRNEVRVVVPTAQRVYNNIGISPTDRQNTEPATNRVGTKFEQPFYISLVDYPFIVDHTIVKQPSHWHHTNDIVPVIPMTMSLELLTEIANNQNKSKKMVQMGPVTVFQWMEVNKPFDQTIYGAWKSENQISLNIKNFINGEFLLDDHFPSVPARLNDEIDWGENIAPVPTVEEVYDKHMFHGPQYQSLEKITNISKKGIRAIAKHAGGKGALLDVIGQLFGVYTQLTLKENFVAFPIKIDAIHFYQDIADQEGVFEFSLLAKEVNDNFLIGDFIMKRNGKVWAYGENWHSVRIGFDKRIWEVTMWPDKYHLGYEIYPGITYYTDYYKKSVPLDFIRRQYLNYQEKEEFLSLPLNKRNAFLFSCVALKDSVRTYIERKNNKYCYPVEIFFKYDDLGMLHVYGLPEVKGLEVSVANDGIDAVAITSDKVVGIGVKKLKEYNEIAQISFTDHEHNLLEGKDKSEWLVRIYVAKEAYRKMLPDAVLDEINRIEDDDILIINNIKIKTINYNNIIIGWTL